MPLFFFHLRGGPDGLSLDKDGLDLLDVEAAYLEAHQTALDMAQEWLRKGRSPEAMPSRSQTGLVRLCSRCHSQRRLTAKRGVGQST